MEARFEGCLIEMMHQTLERLLRVPRRQPRYPGQLCSRCRLRLWWSHNVSPPRVMLPRVLPSAGVTPRPRYYDPSDFLRVVSVFSLVRLGYRYFRPRRTLRISHVHSPAVGTCHALRPRRCRARLPICDVRDGAFGLFYTLGHLINP